MRNHCQVQTNVQFRKFTYGQKETETIYLLCGQFGPILIIFMRKIELIIEFSFSLHFITFVIISFIHLLWH